MAKFFVGQRVMLARGRDLISRAKSYGIQGNVMAFREVEKGTIMADGIPLGVHGNVSVKWDGQELSSMQNVAQLEPILPEGAAPSIYSYQELMDKLREGERV